MAPTDGAGQALDDLLRREWLLANHLGGYASSTVPSLNTRKYHGLLVAAMAPPVRRMVLLSRVEEIVHCEGWPTPLACNEYPGTVHPAGHDALRAFAHRPFPRWAYQGEGWTIEKSLQLLDGANAVVLTYTLLGKKSIDLELRPLLALRAMHELTYQWNGRLGAEEKSPGHHRVPPTSRTPEVFFAHDGAFDAEAAAWYYNTIYRREQERGYAGLEDLWSPGCVRWARLLPGQSVHFVCSADPIELEKAIATAEMQCAQLDESSSPSALVPAAPAAAAAAAKDTDHDLLVAAADAFALKLSPDAVERAGTAMLTKLPWSPPNVRDALIGFAGVLLVTGKFAEAKAMLLGLAAKVHNGLVPTELTEDGLEPQYSGADTSLWFVNAIYQYVRYTGEEATAARLLDLVVQIIRTYRHGANPGIAADADGLLESCSPGRGTSWMDAKVGDWVVTPRAGRAVELNALWYNALRIAAGFAEHAGQASRARELTQLADAVHAAFNATFWNERESCCYDVVDDYGSDASIRPNQLLAISLPYAVLAANRHEAVLERVRRDLLTPMGPRTLAASDAAYRGRYAGDVVARDRAYHNGAVHPWLLGAYVSAHVRVFGRGEKARADARKLLDGCVEHLRGDGLGQICELFDGDAPHRPGGAIASAPAAGELLRCYVEDVLDQQPAKLPAAGGMSAGAAAAGVTINVPPKAATKR